MSVTTNNSLSQDYTNLDNHILQTSIGSNHLLYNNIYIYILYIYNSLPMLHSIYSIYSTLKFVFWLSTKLTYLEYNMKKNLKC